jgi:nanoRNase/pAp phosphatase (c-di-AMP/oligoRNAs hydrolase)
MKERLEKLRRSLMGKPQLLIVPHNDPDPDAIASALGLRYLVTEKFGLEARIGYRGIIGRSENRALVRYLDHPLEKLGTRELHQDVAIALVDTQPGAGNNPLPNHIPATIVIDHHESRRTIENVDFVDLRSGIGATSTIMTEYIQAAGLSFPTNLSTALFYGIKTDTMGLGRGTSDNDVAAYLFLQPRVDVEALSKIERAQVPQTYFKSLTAALHATNVYDKTLVISNIGSMDYPDLGAEIADLLLRIQDVIWVLCLGLYNEELILSVRSRSTNIGAGDIACYIIGDLGTAGGHGTMAGGQIQLDSQDPTPVIEQVIKKALGYIKGDHSLKGKPLI